METADQDNLMLIVPDKWFQPNFQDEQGVKKKCMCVHVCVRVCVYTLGLSNNCDNYCDNFPMTIFLSSVI